LEEFFWSGPKMTAVNAMDDDLVEGLGTQPVEEVSSDDYKRLTGESLSQTVDIARWKRGMDALKDYDRLESEVIEAETISAEVRAKIREKVFPVLSRLDGAPAEAGVYRLRDSDVSQTHRDVLMNGLVEGVDGNVHVFSTMALQIVQIAVVAVNYRAEEESWGHRIFKRDIRVQPGADMVQETLDLLARRAPNSGDKTKPRKVTDMMRRGVMTFMERQILGSALKAPWRIGHGNPLAYELLTGAGSVELLKMSIPVLRQLIEHKRFVFVPSDTTEQHVKTIGDALEPLEYAIVGDSEAYLRRISGGHFTGEWAATMEHDLSKLIADVKSKILIGTYRATPFAPAQVFYAHRDYVHEAARIAIADSVHLDHRGFPMLIEMADNMCRTYFGAQTIERPALAVFGGTEAPFRHLAERSNRR
jgi:hypothetical protein